MTNIHCCSPLLTPVDLATYLGVSVETVRSWRKRGLGPAAVHAGKHLRFRREDVQAWLGQQAA